MSKSKPIDKILDWEGRVIENDKPERIEFIKLEITKFVLYSDGTRGKVTEERCSYNRTPEGHPIIIGVLGKCWLIIPGHSYVLPDGKIVKI